jgi:hypothetical protein
MRMNDERGENKAKKVMFSVQYRVRSATVAVVLQ